MSKTKMFLDSNVYYCLSVVMHLQLSHSNHWASGRTTCKGFIIDLTETCHINCSILFRLWMWNVVLLHVHLVNSIFFTVAQRPSPQMHPFFPTQRWCPRVVIRLLVVTLNEEIIATWYRFENDTRRVTATCVNRFA